MHCSSCSTAVQKALSVTTGVEKASVSLTLEQAEVMYDPSIVQEVTFSTFTHLTAMTTASQYCPSLTQQDCMQPFQCKDGSAVILPHSRAVCLGSAAPSKDAPACCCVRDYLEHIVVLSKAEELQMMH